MTRYIRNLAVLALLAGGALAFANDLPQSQSDGLDIWDDPSFRKEFLGSYGIRSDVEPGLDLDEQTALQEILPLFPDDLDGAALKLRARIAPEELDDGKKKKKKKKKKAAEEAEVKEVSAVFDFLLGNVYYQKHLRGDESQTNLLDQAVPHYEAAIEKFPSYLRAHKNLGLIHVQRNRYTEAIPHLSRVVQLGGADGLTMGLLGWCYLNTEQYVSAESAFRNAVMLQPDVIDWKLGLAQSVTKQGKYGEAVSLSEELIAGDAGNATYWLLQANAYIGLGKPLEAAQNYEMIRRMGKASTASLHTLGDIYVNQELWDLAAQSYLAALESDPEQDVNRPLRNVEILAQRGALDQAKSLLERTKAALGDRIEDTERKNLLKLQARIAVADGTGGDAVALLEEVVAIDPLDGDALMLLGQHYARIDEPEQAIFYYERAESLAEFEADARVRHAQLLVAQARYGEAVPLLKRAQEIEPRDDVARYLEQVERVARSNR
jgi:tetratricopeptide (TPR) repeat protein